MRRTLASLGFALLLAPSLASAGAENAGTTSANFLATGTGARVLGMGGAALALPGGVGAVSWNAGALGFVEDTELSFAHAGLAEGTSQEWIGAGGPIGRSGTRWGLSALYQTEGSFEGRDATGASTGSFDVSSLALGVQVAHRIGGVAALGVGAKWVQENLGSIQGSGVTFDAGLLVRAGRVGIGLAAQNAGGEMKFEDSGFSFPTTYGAGVSFDHPKSGLSLDLDLNVPNAYYKNLRGGVEWKWRDRLALRGGYRAELGASSDEALTGPAFGMGAGAYGLWLDYGYLITGTGSGQHRLGFSLRTSRMSWRPGDPFGQKSIPREYDDGKVAPTAPSTASGSGKKKS